MEEIKIQKFIDWYSGDARIVEACCHQLPLMVIIEEKPKKMWMIDGNPRTEMIIQHIKDVGANYCSLWNWHDLAAENLKRYFDEYPAAIGDLRRCIGYCVSPFLDLVLQL